MPVSCWGPVLGSKVVTYKTATILGLLGQAVGTLAFGTGKYNPFDQFLSNGERLAPYRNQTMYALMWVVVVPLLWDIAAIRQKIVAPLYLGTGAF